MRKRVPIKDLHRSLLLLIAACAPTAYASESALERAALHLNAGAADSIEFEATGTYFQFSQAPGPGQPWPPFDVRDYVSTVDFVRGSVHSRYTRVQQIDPVRARPASGDQKLDQYMIDGVSWNASPTGVPTVMPANLAERTAEIWTTPQGFVRAARAHSASVKRSSAGKSEVAFTLGKYRYIGLIDASGDVDQVRTWMDSQVLGDTAIEWQFADYRDFGGTRFPARIKRVAGGFPWYELAVSRVKTNAATTFSVPDEVARNPVPAIASVNVTTLAPGVFHLAGGTHNSVVVEQARGIVVIEAPLNEQRSLAVIAKIRELIPGKAITHVINTHTHFDHAGGLRTYVNEGATVVTAEPNVAYFEKAWSAPRTLEPDALSGSKRKAHLQGFTGKLVLTDAKHPVEVHEILGSGHSDAFAMIWLPNERVLIEADAWTPAATAPGAPLNPLWKNLHENIERLKLDAERIAPLHGGMQTLTDLQRAIGKPAAPADDR